MSLLDPIPSPFNSEASHARFFHTDVRDLSAAKLWAEQLTLEVELARRIARRVRLHTIVAWPTFISDRAWLLGRLRAIRRELQRRGSSRG